MFGDPRAALDQLVEQMRWGVVQGAERLPLRVQLEQERFVWASRHLFDERRFVLNLVSRLGAKPAHAFLRHYSPNYRWLWDQIKN